MRARPLFLAGLVLLAAALYLLTQRSAGSSSYRVDAIFDSAEGMVPGQLVKIAGAKVGEVSAVSLTPGHRARMELSIERRYGPFHANARCQILPEGPISEYYVECDPGSTAAATLRSGRGGQPPTLPVSQTAVPVSLQNVIDIFSLPVSERISALIDQLGIGTAGEGQNINAILQRADPAIVQGDRVLSVLNAQNRQIAAAVSQSNDVLSALAQDSGGTRAFVDDAAKLATVTAEHRGQLASTVARLPTLLTDLETDLTPLNRVVSDATPLLGQLQKAAPGLTELTNSLPRFSELGTPAAKALASAAKLANATLPAARPVADALRTLASTAKTPALSLAQLLTSTRDHGGFEGLLKLFYALSTDSALYDNTSHIVSATVNAFPACFVETSSSECSHAYDAPDAGQSPINATGTERDSATARLDTSQLRSILSYLLKG